MAKSRLISGFALFGCTWIIGAWDSPLKTLWPVIVALFFVITTRRALWGLLAGALAGSLILSDGNPLYAFVHLFTQHLEPSLKSTWKIGAILFTLILGGFAAVLDAGGGFQTILRFFLRKGGDASKRLQATAAGLGILCFFDGLANSMMVGRVCKEMAKKCGVSRVKLAYIVDSTSSAVACLAFISTWVAYQLSMIKEGYQLAGRDINPYIIFLKSIPFNFYCWFTLALLFVSIFRRFNPGSMKTFEDSIPVLEATSADSTEGNQTTKVGLHTVMIPLIVLILSFLFGFYLLGCSDSLWPVTLQKIATAFGSDAGPLVLTLSGLFAAFVAVCLYPSHHPNRIFEGLSAFKRGVQSLLGPVLILVSAWMIGSVLSSLGTAEYLSSFISGTNASVLIPSLIFITGSVISFSTGTSWGTMGILFPLAIPIAAAVCQSMEPQLQETYLQIAVAAVFSGAVLGDHCSPFSDTTIVSSISCGVEPHDHIRTQIPFALITAAVAIVFGFLPAGFGVSPFLLLFSGIFFLVLLPTLLRKWGKQAKRAN
jgi:tetracycline resistance efflux pump